MMDAQFIDPSEPNLMGKSHQSLKRVIHRKAKICSCDRQKLYKCLEDTCIHSDLLCPHCQIYPLRSSHYNHAFCYVLPFFYSHWENIYEKYMGHLQEYLNQLYNLKNSMPEQAESIDAAIDSVIMKTEAFSTDLGYRKFNLDVKKKPKTCDLNSLFKGIKFHTENFETLLLKTREIISFNNEFEEKKMIDEDLEDFIEFLIQRIKESMRPEPLEPVYLSHYDLSKEEPIRISGESAYLQSMRELYTDHFHESYVEFEVDSCGNRADLIYKTLCQIKNCRKLNFVDLSKTRVHRGDLINPRPIPFKNLQILCLKGNTFSIQNNLKLLDISNIEVIKVEINKFDEQLFREIVLLGKKVQFWISSRKKEDDILPFLKFAISQPHQINFAFVFDKHFSETWSQKQTEQLQECITENLGKIQSLQFWTPVYLKDYFLHTLLKSPCLTKLVNIYYDPEPGKLWQQEVYLKLERLCLERSNALYAIAKGRKNQSLNTNRNQILFSRIYKDFITGPIQDQLP